MKIQTEASGCLLAQKHTVHEDFEIFTDLTIVRTKGYSLIDASNARAERSHRFR